jgi:hypothetical protein
MTYVQVECRVCEAEIIVKIAQDKICDFCQLDPEQPLPIKITQFTTSEQQPQMNVKVIGFDSPLIAG